MLMSSSFVNEINIEASDGLIGVIKDVLFDDATWLIRWLVVDTGDFLQERRVLLPPSVVVDADCPAKKFSVSLSKQQVKNSPDTDTAKPVSRQMEANLYDHYDHDPYWAKGLYMAGYGFSGGVLAPPLSLGTMRRSREQAQSLPRDGDPRLRSMHEVTGYHIHARDGEIGHVDDFLLEDSDWSVHYLVIDTKNWWPGKKVLISPLSIRTTDWARRSVNLDIDRAGVRGGPAFDTSTTIDRAYEAEFHKYYAGLKQRA